MRYTVSGIHRGGSPSRIPLRNQEPILFLCNCRKLVRTVDSFVSAPAAPLVSSELGPCVLRAQFVRPPDPAPQVETVKLEVEKSAVDEDEEMVDSEEKAASAKKPKAEHCEDPIQLIERESDFEEDEPERSSWMNEESDDKPPTFRDILPEEEPEELPPNNFHETILLRHLQVGLPEVSFHK